MKIESEIAKRIRLVAFDVDGVMTDAGVYIGMAGESLCELKKFSTQDSVGLKMLQAAGIEVALVSGRVSEATDARAKELGIREVIQVRNALKVKPLKAMLSRLGVELCEVVFVGDDLPDIPVMKIVGLSVGVGNSVQEVREIATVCTEKSGGDGAVREFAEALLRARGEWDRLVERYLSAQDEPTTDA